MAELLGGAEDDHLVIRAATLSSPTEERKITNAQDRQVNVSSTEERCSVSSRTKHVAKTTKKWRNFQQDM